MRRKRTYIDFLRDMLAYAQTAEELLGDMDLQAFMADKRTALAVTRALEIIGEAARHVPAETRRRYPDVPWSRAVAMRNIVIHGYFGVDLEVIWKTIREDLPPLREAVARALAELEREERPG